MPRISKDYRPVSVLKRDGSIRAVMEPCDSLKREQRWILDNILASIPLHPSCHGFVSGRSIVTNASQHCNRSLVINVDLTSFFHAVTFQRTRGIFRALIQQNSGISCTSTVASILSLANHYAALCTIQTPNGRYIPQGACTSPMLANLAARNLDSRLNGLASSLGMTYTRYADDMTFSEDIDNGHQSNGTLRRLPENTGLQRMYEPQQENSVLRMSGVRVSQEHRRTIGTLLCQCRRIILSEGFNLNESKTRVMVAPDIRLVTGLDVSGSIPAIPLKTLERYVRLLSRPHSQQTRAGITGHMTMVNQ